jgi:hypothetical protein
LAIDGHCDRVVPTAEYRLVMTPPAEMVGTSSRARARLELWREKLSIVEHAMAAELRRPMRDRRTNLLFFLYREKSVCINVISELLPFAQEPNDSSIDDVNA